MTDLLEQGLGWLNDMRGKHMSQTVVYGRAGDSVEVQATLGRTEYEVTDEAGVTVQAVATDFIAAAADLVLSGQLVSPEPGDQIRVTAGANVLVYEVMDLGGAGHYRPGDAYGNALRVHTKQVDTETP